MTCLQGQQILNSSVFNAEPFWPAYWKAIGPLETKAKLKVHYNRCQLGIIYIFENFEVVVIFTWNIMKIKWSIIGRINDLITYSPHLCMNDEVKKKELLTHQQKRYHTIFNMQRCNKSLAWKHDHAKAFWVRVQPSIGLKGYANQYKVVLGTSAIILMSSWEIGTSLGGLSVSLFSFLTPVTRSLFQCKAFE